MRLSWVQSVLGMSRGSRQGVVIPIHTACLYRTKCCDPQMPDASNGLCSSFPSLQFIESGTVLYPWCGGQGVKTLFMVWRSRGQDTFYGVVKGSRHVLWCGGQGVKTLFMVWSRGQDTFYGVVKGSRHFLWCGQ